MNKYLFASFSSLLMTALLFAFVLVYSVNVAGWHTVYTLHVGAGTAE